MFQVNGFSKISEEDHYENGCDPDTTQMTEVDLSFRADTLEQLLNKIKQYFGVDEVQVFDGKLQFARLENHNSVQAFESEIDMWKEGNKTLYHTTYTTTIEKIEEFELTPEKVKEVT